jgi:cytosine/adenosine deaminase-related metal-dependent hydrolase
MTAAEYQYDFGIKNILTFIDIDEFAEERAIKAAVLAKDKLKRFYGVNLMIANQTLSGVTNPKIKNLIEKNMDNIDILGGLPRVENFSNHIDTIFSWAKETGKRVHVHVDQLNTKKEHETEMLAIKTKEYGLYDQVTAVHSISLAAHPKSYRQQPYKRS